MVWYPILGYGAFWIGAIVSLILYLVKRKWYPIMYLISVALYIFTIGFVIDVFNLSKNWILGILALSATIMLGMGYYVSQRFQKKSKKVSKKKKNE